MINTEEFIKRLQKVMDYYGESASSFAEKVGVQRSSISHILSGRNKPSLEFVMKVLQQFPEVQLYWLLNGTGNFPSTPSEKSTASSSKLLSTLATEVGNPPIDVGLEKSASERESNADLKNSAEIERIIIFYKDGSFKSYQ